MVVLRIEIANEMQANSEGATANLKDTRVRRDVAGVSKELKHVSPTCPGLTIVAVVLLNKKLTRAWEGCVVVCVSSFIMWYAFEPGKENLFMILTKPLIIYIKTEMQKL